MLHRRRYKIMVGPSVTAELPAPRRVASRATAATPPPNLLSASPCLLAIMAALRQDTKREEREIGEKEMRERVIVDV